MIQLRRSRKQQSGCFLPNGGVLGVAVIGGLVDISYLVARDVLQEGGHERAERSGSI